MELSVVLTSAAVAAVVSGLFMMVSQWLERGARQRELAMKTATDLAIKERDFYLEIAKLRPGKSQIPPLPFITYYYNQQLLALLQCGKLTTKEQKLYEEFMNEMNSSQPPAP